VLIGVPRRFFHRAAQGLCIRDAAVPISLPSRLLERRYDVVSAERQAASANAQIGRRGSGFLPDSRSGGARWLCEQPVRSPHLDAQPLLDLGSHAGRDPVLRRSPPGRGARNACDLRRRRGHLPASRAHSVSERRRQHVVLESSSARDQAYTSIYQRNQTLFEHTRAQREIGAASEQSLLNVQLTLLSASRIFWTASVAHSKQRDLDQEPRGRLAVDESREAAATTSMVQHTGTGLAERLAAR